MFAESHLLPRSRPSSACSPSSLRSQRLVGAKFSKHPWKKKGIPLHDVITVMRPCAAAVGAVSAVVACAIACAIAGVQVGLVVELEEIFGAPGGYSGALEVTGVEV